MNENERYFNVTNMQVTTDGADGVQIMDAIINAIESIGGYCTFGVHETDANGKELAIKPE